MKKRFNNKYYILRHGQTIYQAKKRKFAYHWPDKPPVRLTKKGEEQIKKIAKKLKDSKIGFIISSDVYRTRQAAGIVAKELGLKVDFDERLRDINLGIYHGRRREEFYRDFSDPKRRFLQKPKKGESWNDVKKRLRDFLREIERKYKNKKILIVSHGDSLWLLEGIIEGFSNKELLKEISKGNYIKVGELRKLHAL